jgi:4-amino-4-deoxy-L-arabinose transferase-like glycosyltransferase
VVAVAAVLYGWRSGTYLEGYYAAAVRSMSMSWHVFLFGGFDPAGTVTLDKLPGAFWVQALSVRLFGLHTWSIVLPQVIEGVLSVLVLFRIVRRLCGPRVGLLAAAVLTLAPATVALNRGIADTLMVLLLLVAADATVTAVVDGRWRHLVLAGLGVGLAFQAKMIEAWVVLPALWVVVMVAAGGRWPRRLAGVGVLTAVAVAVSLSWMTAVTVTPAASRPYVDGSPDNSVYHQVFVYNGFGRVDQASPNQLLSRSIGLEIPPPPPPSWSRLLTGSLGRDVGWLIPGALVSLAAGLWVTRRRPRQDRLRAHFLLWGVWLLGLAGTFSVSSSLNPYYTAALSPALAGLMAGGVLVAWRGRHSPLARVVVAVTALGTAVYADWLLPPDGTGLPGWLGMVVLGVGATAAAALLLSVWPRIPTRLVLAGLATALVALMLVPTVASASIVAHRLGPFDTPFQPVRVTASVRAFFGVAAGTATLLPRLEQVRHGAPFLMATETSALAAPFIFVSGQEVLPVGGFTGVIPSPTLPALQTMVAQGRFHLVLQSASATDPRFVWIARHCLPVAQPHGAGTVSTKLAIYYCLPSSVGHG